MIFREVRVLNINSEWMWTIGVTRERWRKVSKDSRTFVYHYGDRDWRVKVNGVAHDMKFTSMGAAEMAARIMT